MRRNLGTFSAISGGYSSSQDFQYEWFIPDDAPLQKSRELSDEYSGGGQVVYGVTEGTPGFKYETSDDQDALGRLREELTASKWTVGVTSSWAHEFDAWVRACCGVGPTGAYEYCAKKKIPRDSNGEPTGEAPEDGPSKYVEGSDGAVCPASGESHVPDEHYWVWLDQWVMDAADAHAYAADLAWVSTSVVRTEAEAEEGVKATRFRSAYNTDKASSASDQISSMDDLRDSVDAADAGDAYAYMYPFLFFEQYKIIVREAVLNLSLALIAVTIITALMLFDVRATVLVVLNVLMVDVDILGLMYFWGLTVDSVTIVNLVLAIGLSVDYSVHVAHSFVTSSGTKQERAEKALVHMGTPVLHGATSTFIAILVLSGSKTYIFRVFFKQFFGICIFGAAHGLIFLPACLALIGPPELKGAAKVAEDMKEASPKTEMTPTAVQVTHRRDHRRDSRDHASCHA